MSRLCPDCGAAVAEDQRYCVSCGAALRPRPETVAPEVEPETAETELRAPRSPPPLVLTLRIGGRTGIVRLPSGRLSTVLAAGMLACGLMIGIAVGPVALGSSAAAAAGQIITLIGGGPSSPQAASTTSTSTTSSDSSGVGGAGSLLGGPSATPATSSAAPASAPASAAPGVAATTTSTTTSTSTTSTLAKLNAAGTVVANDFASQSFDAVDSKHRLLEVHSAKLAATLPAVGTCVRFADSPLANGTTSASRTVNVQRARPATVVADGIVSFVNTANASYVLSARGVSLPIDTAATPAPTAPAATPAPATTTTTTTTQSTTTTQVPPQTLGSILLGPTNVALPPTPTATPTNPATPASPAGAGLPSVGQRLEVTISLPLAGATGPAASTLREVSRIPKGQASGPLELAGVITSFDKTKQIAAISADGPGLGSDTIPLSVPPSIALNKLGLPATVVAHVTFAAGIYTLTGLARDDSATAAANRTKFLGDLGTKARVSRARKRSQSLQARARVRGNGA